MLFEDRFDDPFRFAVSNRGFQGGNRKRNPFDLSTHDDAILHEALEFTNNHATTASLDQFDHNIEAIARKHRVSKTDIFQTAKANHLASQQIMFLSVVRCQLSCCLTHDYAGHQRHARHVSAYPEFILGCVSVTDAAMMVRVLMDNRRQLLHLETLGIETSYRFNIRRDRRKVDVRKIE